MIHRILNPLKSNSFFLFGPRGTGKTTWLKQHFSQTNNLWIDLLSPSEEERYALNPSILEEQIKTLKPNWVIIDEVQKLPKLLDVVHREIEKRSAMFVLTGSSARKLKRGAANMLAGRAFLNHMHPLTHIEYSENFNLEQSLTWGNLPQLLEYSTNEEKKAYLKTYAQVYLKEEIISEQIIRKLDPFRRFLRIAAQQNGEIINFTNIGRDVSANVRTVQSYFQILEDTLLGFLLPAYHRSIRKQQSSNPKFYFFDVGIKRTLDGTIDQIPVPNTYGYGKAFEHFIILEMLRLNDYYGKDFQFYYLRTKDQAEIDLIIERPGQPLALVEIKSATHVDNRDTHTLERFRDGFPGADLFCLSQDPISRQIGHVQAFPWEDGLINIGFKQNN